LDSSTTKAVGDTHHHHVPQNAFLSIGLQTSVAIALHKLPEGFITYATNHASPTLGLTVFLALFIHNIVEGFAMALPLYLALSSRWKAMFWSSLLGGISQPAGAGLAALWIWSSGHTGSDSRGPSWGVYGGMFAATAGVMTSVALQLFSEGLGLTHRRSMGIGFAVAGMGLMGLSFALTA
jgi:ZIP family zinc transporter